MMKATKPPTIKRQYHTWHEFLDAAEPAKPNGVSRASSGQTIGTEGRISRSWALGLDFDKTLRLARTVGWQEEVKRCDTYCGQVRALAEAEREEDSFTYLTDVAGAEVDMDRYLTDDPECMVEALPIKLSKVGQVIRLIVDCGAACTCGSETCNVEPVSSDAIRGRGMAVMSLIDALHRAQHQLEVWVVHAVNDFQQMCEYDYQDVTLYEYDYQDVTRPGKGRHSVAVCVQRANAPIDMGRLMLAISHPAMLRRLIFSVEEQERPDVRKHFGFNMRYSYGVSTDASVDDLPHADGCTIVLPKARSGENWAPEVAAKWVTTTLNEIGLA